MIGTASFTLGQLFLEILDEFLHADPDGPAECPQFHNIHSPLTAFAFADERLSCAQAGREHFLRQTRVFPGLSQGLDEVCILAGANGLVHPGSSLADCTAIYRPF